MANDIEKAGANPLAMIMGADMRDGLIFKTSCTLCNSPVRGEAEKMFDEGRTLVQIKAFLDGKNEPLSLSNIRHHLKEHHQSLERKALLAEYCQNLDAMRQRVRDKFSDVQCTIDISLMELTRAVSHPTGGDMAKEAERFDMVMKANKMLREGIALLHEMDSSEARIKAVHMQLVKVWKAAIEGAKTDSERQTYIQLFNNFKDLTSMIVPDPEPK
jgi:hypothetical protein